MVLLVTFSSLLFHHPMSSLNVMGVSATVLGVGYYNYIRASESAESGDSVEAVEAVAYTSLITNSYFDDVSSRDMTLS